MDLWGEKGPLKWSKKDWSRMEGRGVDVWAINEEKTNFEHNEVSERPKITMAELSLLSFPPVSVCYFAIHAMRPFFIFFFFLPFSIASRPSVHSCVVPFSISPFFLLSFFLSPLPWKTKRKGQHSTRLCVE